MEESKQLGDDWTEETTVQQVVVDINAVLTAQWKAKEWNPKVVLTLTIPALWIERLKEETLPGPGGRMTSWMRHIEDNNVLTHSGGKVEIVPQ